jgi:predicted transcriptional regulator
MVEKGITKTEIASALGIDAATLYRKLNGISDFKRQEIEIIRSRLGLTVNEAEAIFFAD